MRSILLLLFVPFFFIATAAAEDPNQDLLKRIEILEKELSALKQTAMNNAALAEGRTAEKSSTTEKSSTLDLELAPADIALNDQSALNREPRAKMEIEDISADGFETADQSGNDPRDFGNKFMPYYRHMELENEVEVNSLTLFGFFAFNNRFGMTYELPVAHEVDYSDVDAFQMGSSMGTLPNVGSQTGSGGGVPFAGLDSDGNEVGMGDTILRFFGRPQALEWGYMNDTKNFSLMPLFEMTVPTASEDVLGGEALIVSPGFVTVFDLPFEDPPFGLAFFAMMHFFDFDAYRDNSRPHTTRYRGRWFYMQPLSKPAFADNPGDESLHIFDTTGIYTMIEMQPIYDNGSKDFSFWVGPEFGKILKEGVIVYGKPGWGIDNDQGGDREFTFEFGFRYFM